MQSLLPDRPASVPGYEFWAYYEPARHVGGDYYGFIPMPAPSGEDESSATLWAIAVGDVVGKGMPAALLNAKLSDEVRAGLPATSTTTAWTLSSIVPSTAACSICTSRSCSRYSTFRSTV